MLRPTTRITLALSGALLAVGLVGASVVQSAATGVSLTTTLNHPRGLTALPGGNALVAEAGTGRILRVLPDGTQQVAYKGFPVASTLASGPLETLGVSAITSDGDGGYFVVVGGSASGSKALYSVSVGGAINLQLDLGAFEVANNSDGGRDANGDPVVQSNPYDVAIDVFGAAHVSDSSANVILRHEFGGVATKFFVFPNIPNPLYPLNGPATIAQTPTGMAVGPDGAIYVATFTAPPYPQGEARVYRLQDGNFDGDAQDNGEWSIYATGLTTATDVAFDASGTMFVSEYSTSMPSGKPGRVSRIVNGKPVPEVLLLTSPTSLAITDDGRMLVTEETIGRIADVTSVSSGGFSPAIGKGLTFTKYGGGTVDQLAAEAGDAGASAVAVTIGGKLIVLLPGAPAFVNQKFKTYYPGEVPPNTLLLVIRP